MLRRRRWRSNHRPDRAPLGGPRATRGSVVEVELLVRHDLVAGHVVVALDGFVDLSSLPTLHSHLHTAIREHPGATVAVDLEAVESLDDAGLGVLLGAAGRAREQHGELVIICNDPRLRERFERTGLDRAISVRDRLAGGVGPPDGVRHAAGDSAAGGDARSAGTPSTTAPTSRHDG